MRRAVPVVSAACKSGSAVLHSSHLSSTFWSRLFLVVEGTFSIKDGAMSVSFVIDCVQNALQLIGVFAVVYLVYLQLAACKRRRRGVHRLTLMVTTDARERLERLLALGVENSLVAVIRAALTVYQSSLQTSKELP